MDGPSELSLLEIHKFMLENGCKVTNHALVKHFKRFLTNNETQNESRKQFKTFVNILATIKTENNEKFLVLRKKYLNACPTEDSLSLQGGNEVPMSPGGVSLSDPDDFKSPQKEYPAPPPYKLPPSVVSSKNVEIPILQKQTTENYRDCVNEFQAAMTKLNLNNNAPVPSDAPDIRNPESSSPSSSIVPNSPCINNNSEKSNDKEVINSDKENIENSNIKSNCENNNNNNNADESERVNTVSVKEAARKFNRMASEEETKVLSPSNKKKVEKVNDEEKVTPEVTMAHPKAKEWIVAAARANYQELAKLAQEYPELVKLQDPTATALHWAAKHGNEDVVKLIAGTYKANVDARTNGGYTPLHIAMQFGKDNIFELLCNVYKANRDLLDWSGNKPLDYRKQKTTISASTYSSEYNYLSPEWNYSSPNNANASSNYLASGGSFTFSRKKQYSSSKKSSLSRSYSMMIYPPAAFKQDSSSKNFEISSKNERHASLRVTGKEFTSKRKGSFLRKKNKASNQFKNTEKIRAKRKHTEKDLSFLRIGSLNVRVKRTTEAFSNFLGVGTNSNVNYHHHHNNGQRHRSIDVVNSKSSQQRSKQHHHRHHHDNFDKIHKNWGSADNIQQHGGMPPPTKIGVKKGKSKRATNDHDSQGYNSMPSTPNQIRAPICNFIENTTPSSSSTVNNIDSDSDSAYGFDSNWSVERGGVSRKF